MSIQTIPGQNTDSTEHQETTSSTNGVSNQPTVSTGQDYVDRKGNVIPLAHLQSDERDLLRKLGERAEWPGDSSDFWSFSMLVVASFYEGRGLSRLQSRDTAAFRIAQDLCATLLTKGRVSTEQTKNLK